MITRWRAYAVLGIICGMHMSMKKYGWSNQVGLWLGCIHFICNRFPNLNRHVQSFYTSTPSGYYFSVLIARKKTLAFEKVHESFLEKVHIRGSCQCISHTQKNPRIPGTKKKRKRMYECVTNFSKTNLRIRRNIIANQVDSNFPH